jgi:hypothetical protein
MRGIGPFSPRQKMIITIGSAVLTVAFAISLITQLTSGSEDWPFSAIGVAAGPLIILMVRRAPTIGEDR